MQNTGRYLSHGLSKRFKYHKQDKLNIAAYVVAIKSLVCYI
jgi:hypothetical protein